MSASPTVFATLDQVTVVSPGPTSLLALDNGARRGVAAALPGIAGALLSDATLMAAVALGLGGVMAASAWAFDALRWLGVACLAWLGWGLLRWAGGAAGHAAYAQAKSAGSEPALQVLWRSYAVAVTKPKGALFFRALLPSFVFAHAPLRPQYLLLALVFVAIDGAVLLAQAGAGAAGARNFGCSARAKRRLDQASGSLLLLMALGPAPWRRELA